ncbi:MAG: peptidylprolyl isomerase [Burkholderiales bacterium]|nr:peptidylprolyl isomerase [Burkholderiales bacterium]
MDDCTTTLPRIAGIALVEPRETPGAEELRQRACSELLRQAAIAAGLLAADDPPPQRGAMSEAAAAAIEALLDRDLPLTEPDEESCRRWHAAHAARYAQGERVRARHVLFAVTPGVDIAALRGRAEACLLDLRSRSDEAAFARAAAECSNCPSAQLGGELGWLQAGDCAPEFARELFGAAEVGVLARLVHSRYGLHVVEVLEREPGRPQSYESVRAAVAQTLRQQAFATALRQYLQALAEGSRIEGIDLEAATPSMP